MKGRQTSIESTEPSAMTRRRKLLFSLLLVSMAGEGAGREGGKTLGE